MSNGLPRDSRGRSSWAGLWLAAAAALPILAVLLGAWEGELSSRASRTACQRVQTLVGGHGLGAVTMPAWCTFTFDPRSQPLCSCPVWPIPGGPCFCPDHASVVARLREAPASARLPVAIPRPGPPGANERSLR